MARYTILTYGICFVWGMIWEYVKKYFKDLSKLYIINTI